MEFAYVLRPAFDQAFMERATERELRVFEEHGEWLEAGFAEGRVRFAGRCYDGPFGMVVIEADDERHARSLMERDPSVREDVQTGRAVPVQDVHLSRARSGRLTSGCPSAPAAATPAAAHAAAPSEPLCRIDTDPVAD